MSLPRAIVMLGLCLAVMLGCTFQADEIVHMEDRIKWLRISMIVNMLVSPFIARLLELFFELHQRFFLYSQRMFTETPSLPRRWRLQLRWVVTLLGQVAIAQGTGVVVASLWTNFLMMELGLTQIAGGFGILMGIKFMKSPEKVIF